MSLGNVSKYEFLTSKDVLPGKELLEKAATMKRFEYSPLDNELKAQTGVAKDQDNLFKDFLKTMLLIKAKKIKEKIKEKKKMKDKLLKCLMQY